MSVRHAVYAVVGLNVLHVLILLGCLFLLPRLQFLDFGAMRTKIEASASLEDLRPRASQAVSALASGDSVIRHLHSLAVNLAGFGIALIIVNTLLLCFLLPRLPRS